jgi:membrane protease YdiL (CAAX protease family)
MLRGPRQRWWRSLLALLLVGVFGFVLMLVAFLPVVLAGALVGIADPARWAAAEVLKTSDLGPGGFLYVNLSLIVLIPAAGLSIWIAHRLRPRFLASVQGGIRWRWLLRCFLVVLPVWVIYFGASIVADSAASSRPAHWAMLLVMVVCLTPFQAAGEEYLFRGWILQNVGAEFKNPYVGLVVGVFVSVVAFSAAHGSPNVWVLGSLGALAVSASIAAWRTGGLEAGIAIHAVNNICVFFIVILYGGWQQAFVNAKTTSTPLAFGVDLAVNAIALTLILWQAKKMGIRRHYFPPTAGEGHPAGVALTADSQSISGSRTGGAP